MSLPQSRADLSASLRPAHRALAVLAAAGLAVGLVGCSAPNRSRASTEYSDTRYSRSEIGDCDAEDRREQEMPDCGRLVNGVYQEWDWVRAGRVTPPSGWSPPREQPPGYSPAPASGGRAPGAGTKAGAPDASTRSADSTLEGFTGGPSTGTKDSTGSKAGGSSGAKVGGGSGSTSGGTRTAPRPRTGRR